VLVLTLVFVFIVYMGTSLFSFAFTGYVVDDGIVQIDVAISRIITIFSPEDNATYNFDKGDPYIIELNVSADFDVDEWKYGLFDSRHGVVVENDTAFVPNSSIVAVRWDNILTVYAHEVDGEWYSQSSLFYVNISNSAPILSNFSDLIYVCEAESLEYEINATDIDEDDLIGDISPKNPFYLSIGIRLNWTINYFNIISGALGKDDVGVHNETVSVVDVENLTDSQNVTIVVIEINNPPVVEDIGAQTVWLVGENSSFDYRFDVDDVEDGINEDGNLTFNLTWDGGENLFDIGSSDGVMNYSPTLGEEGETYSLTVCVEDNPLGNVHENISLCSPRDGDVEIVCDNFTLTVTDENRPPNITAYTPVNTSLNMTGTVTETFSAWVYDPDGTIPDIDWYVDDVLIEHNENVPSDSFNYSFECGVSGNHSIEIVTTDGLLNDSQAWNISVSSVDCPVIPVSSGGGAAASSGGYCFESWFCDDWNVCQNVESSFYLGVLLKEDYIFSKEICLQNGEEDARFCGFQITNCYDLNACERSDPIVARPEEKRFCSFTENPSCSDRIKNCHGGGCELLIDCGGPCSACSTCSDGLQNQGESGVDCGGPCPFICEPEVPFAIISKTLIVLAILALLLVLYLLWRMFLLSKKENEDEDENKSA